MRIFTIVMMAASLLPDLATAQTTQLTGTFNSQKPILPSSQYTPAEPYSAQVWVFNEGRRYNDADYNHIWAVPPTDDEGREWFHPDYTLTDDANASWQQATAPFSSDEYYKSQRSFRWTTVDITADIYMRRTFTLNAICEGMVYLACGHDDAPAEWYLNGVQVHSVADGWNNDEVHRLSDEHKALLHTDGTPNVIAAHVHQNYGGAFADCGLYEADMALTTTLLHNVTEHGAWPCLYYMLNYNTDLAVAEEAGWASDDEDEDDWISGVGPFSNDNNMFYTTEWPSQVRPILVRRHFSLSADLLARAIDPEATAVLTCSYDENPVVYLNGTRIWSANGWNDNNYATFNLTAEQRSLMREGDNVLAVSLMQGGGGGHIDYGLRITSPYGLSGIESPGLPEDAAVPADNRIFNLHGRYLGTDISRLPAGIYIVGGKKRAITR